MNYIGIMIRHKIKVYCQYHIIVQNTQGWQAGTSHSLNVKGRLLQWDFVLKILYVM